jgi:alpha-tubulin suppressor-like RCC1 family protein
LSIYGEVYVAGSLDGGKLGLGRGLRKGYQLDFTQVPVTTIPEIEYIACGESHMLAISRFNPDADLTG